MATAIESLPESRPAANTTSIDFFEVRSAAELRAYESAWHELDRQVTSPMQTFAWIEACAETFGASGRVEVLVGRAGDEIVAAAPLLIPSGWAGRAELLNYYRVFEPADFAYRDGEALAALAQAVCDRRRPFLLERIFAAAPTVATLERAVGPAAWLTARPQSATPWIPLDESWSAPEQKLSSRRRSDFRRSWRHAEQAGAVRTEHHAPDPDEVDHLLDLAFDVEKRSWKGAAGTALADGRHGDFYRRYARSAALAGKFRVELLYIGEQIAAMQLAVVHQNRYWVLKVGYDPDFQRASPGILLMVEAIKRAVADELSTYELLGTVEPWIQVWTELERPCLSLRYYPANWRGATALAGDALRKFGEQGKRRIRLAKKGIRFGRRSKCQD
ncbi:MAG TPA: GNAT family N-acetyltransferase [Pirellulales bacterium]|nr:GNAT family N-acetyltransferase [Pirellulales bacterium]